MNNINRYALLAALAVLVPATCESATRFSYTLEKSADAKLCSHMTEVFNKDFGNPWEIPDKTNYQQTSAPQMLWSRYPTSPEFDAIQWKEGKIINKRAALAREVPMLVAKIDIDNDGVQNSVIKYSFLEKRPTDLILGSGDSDSANSNALLIYESEEFDPNKPLSLDEMFDAQKRRSARKLDGKAAYQLRPFIYVGKVYLAAYRAQWRNRSIEQRRADGYLGTPDREYMDILRVTKGGRFRDSEVIRTANTERVCRILMRLSNQQAAFKGTKNVFKDLAYKFQS